MRLALPLIILIAAVPALACQPMGPATANWAQCAAMHVDAASLKAAAANPAARAAWAATWRPKLTAACGSFATAMATDRAAGQAKVAVPDELTLLELVAA